jgi:hypothetical protein
MLSDILFLRAGSVRCFCNYHVGRHVEINLKLIHMASGIKTYTLVAMLIDLKSSTWTYVEPIGVLKI